MAIYLGLGSNLGDRRANLDLGVGALVRSGFSVDAVSPVVDTPALLPQDAESSWNRPFLNCVIEGNADWSPDDALGIIRDIEDALGRSRDKRWAPRPLDIDILLWDDQRISCPNLVIPHEGMEQRSFVLTPMMHLNPGLRMPGQDRTMLQLGRAVHPVPLWMGILNLTPDSFSDGGVWRNRDDLASQVDSMIDANVQIIDVGAESTRPGASITDPVEEWNRLGATLELIFELVRGRNIRPLVSIDSRNPATVEKALDAGVDIVNDVSGLEHPDMQRLVKDSGCQAVAMHSLSIPVEPGEVLDPGESAVTQIEGWLARHADLWSSAGLDLDKIIFDPGIGFGKTPLQSLELLQNCEVFQTSGLRLLIGHSRKSFMGGFTDAAFADRDLETLGISLALCQKGVDIIRVHDPVMHLRAYRAWSHVAS